MSEAETLYPAPSEWTVTLATPVVNKGGTFSELKLREPTMGELVKAMGELGAMPSQQSQVKMQVSIVTIVSGLDRAVVEAMPWPVVVGAAEWLMSFTHVAPLTPVTSSAN